MVGGKRRAWGWGARARQLREREKKKRGFPLLAPRSLSLFPTPTTHLPGRALAERVRAMFSAERGVGGVGSVGARARGVARSAAGRGCGRPASPGVTRRARSLAPVSHCSISPPPLFSPFFSPAMDQPVHPQDAAAPPADEDAELTAHSLWIGDLPPTADEAWVAGLFEGGDGVLEAKVVRSRATGRCQGYGFLSFASPAAAAAALARYAGAPIPGGWGGVFRLNWASGSGGGGAAKEGARRGGGGGWEGRGEGRREGGEEARARRPRRGLGSAPPPGPASRAPAPPTTYPLLLVRRLAGLGRVCLGRAGPGPPAREGRVAMLPPPLFFLAPPPLACVKEGARSPAFHSARPGPPPSAHATRRRESRSGLFSDHRGNGDTPPAPGAHAARCLCAPAFVTGGGEARRPAPRRPGPPAGRARHPRPSARGLPTHGGWVEAVRSRRTRPGGGRPCPYFFRATRPSSLKPHF